MGVEKFNFSTFQLDQKNDELSLSFESTIWPMEWNVQQNPLIGKLYTVHNRHYSHSTVYNGARHVSLCFFLTRAPSGQVFGALSFELGD